MTDDDRSVARYGPGASATSTKPGDFVLTHRSSIPSRIIAFGQGVRFRGDRRSFAHWSHAALVVGWDGELTEALGKGVELTNLERYRDVEYHYVKVSANSDERLHAISYAFAMAKRHTRYGWVEILSLGLQLATSARLALTTDGRMICSGLVATALERTDAVFPRNAGCMMPADLAEYYGVRSDGDRRATISLG